MILKEWNKVKGVFKKPKIKVYFGFWSVSYLALKLGEFLLNKGFDKYPILTKIWRFLSRTDSSLPVWRRGNTISLFSKHHKWVLDKEKHTNYFDWDDEFKSKLKKLHLSWLKPHYTLPTIFSFYIFKRDVMYKWKYDELRYEYPPQFTIVFFNISLTLHWCAPVKDFDYTSNDRYWTSVLSYIYEKSYYEKNDILGLAQDMGWSKIYRKGDYENGEYVFNFSPEFVKDQVIAEKIEQWQKNKMTELIKINEFLTCSECGGRMAVEEGKVCLTDPVQYKYKFDVLPPLK